MFQGTRDCQLTKGRLRLCRSTWTWSVLTDRRTWQDEPGDLKNVMAMMIFDRSGCWIWRRIVFLVPVAVPWTAKVKKKDFNAYFNIAQGEMAHTSEIESFILCESIWQWSNVYHKINCSASCLYRHHQLANTKKRATFIFLWPLKWLRLVSTWQFILELPIIDFFLLCLIFRWGHSCAVLGNDLVLAGGKEFFVLKKRSKILHSNGKSKLADGFLC